MDAEKKPALAHLGLTRKRSAQWQLEAQLPDEEFASYIQETLREGKEPSTSGLLRAARMHVERAQLAQNGNDPLAHAARGLERLACQCKQFASIYIDPPALTRRDARANDFHFDKRLKQLPIRKVATSQAHLYLRVSPDARKHGIQTAEAWGFSVKASLVRLGEPLQADNPWRPVRELWLLCVRGKSAGDVSVPPHWIEGEGIVNASSTEAFCRFVERISRPPYLDLFGSAPFSKDWSAAS
jgi:hypothetical protein